MQWYSNGDVRTILDHLWADRDVMERGPDQYGDRVWVAQVPDYGKDLLALLTTLHREHPAFPELLAKAINLAGDWFVVKSSIYADGVTGYLPCDGEYGALRQFSDLTEARMEMAHV